MRARRKVPLIHVCPECGAEKEWWASRIPFGLCAECRAKRKAESPRDPEYHKAYSLRAKYGITIEEKQSLIDACGGRCVICGKPFSRTRPPHLDHRHCDGLIRGVPCGPCNQALGHSHENIAWFKAAVDYLEHPPAVAVIGARYVPDSPGAAT